MAEPRTATDPRLIGGLLDRAWLERVADWLAVAVAVSLPWSTSASIILIVVWALVLIPTLDFASLSRELRSAAGGLPVLLCLAALLGTLWADVSWSERIGGLTGYYKLIAIPLLFVQFRRSDRGSAALIGFLASCVVLLIVSWTVRFSPQFHVPGKLPGIVVKDYIAQSTEFLICTFALVMFACERLRSRAYWPAVGFALLALAFLLNIFYTAPGRTALVVVPLLVLLLGFREFGWKGTLAGVLVCGLLAGTAWVSSPLLRARMLVSLDELQQYRDANAITSAGVRLEFWRKSLDFIAGAPVFGNGTGTIPALFRRAAVGETGASGVVSVNPHNQYLAVAIELGVVGLAILIAMWVAHLALFRGGGVIPWLGLVIVLQNIVSSLFNSHLSDFLHGWLYVFGVGIAGGMALRARDAPPGRPAAP